MAKKKIEPPRRGRPVVPDSERSLVVSTSLDGAARRYCQEIGGGSVGRGLRELVTRAMAAESGTRK